MNTKLKTLIGVSAIALGLAAAHPSMARGGDRGMNVERLARHLDLNEQQRTEIAGIIEESQTEAEAFRDAIHDTREQLTALTNAETFDEDAAKELANAQAESRAELIVLRARTRHEIGTVLTAEQREKLAQKRERRMKRHGNGALKRIDSDNE